MLALDRKAPNWLIQLLLQSGADPHLNDGGGRTVLYYAVREPNMWAIKRLIAENVDTDTPIRYVGQPRTVLGHLLNFSDLSFSWGSKDFTLVLNYLRAIQVLALSVTDNVVNSFGVKRTPKQLIKCLHSIIARSVELSRSPLFGTYEMMGKDLQEIRDIVQVLVDTLSNPLSLSRLCRNHIRRSLGRDFHRKLCQLNLPLPLQEYLEIYKESDLSL